MFQLLIDTLVQRMPSEKHTENRVRKVAIQLIKPIVARIQSSPCYHMTLESLGPVNKAVESRESGENECLRLATGALNTSPIIPLQVEADVCVTPLYMWHWALTMHYGMRVNSVCRRPSLQITHWWKFYPPPGWMELLEKDIWIPYLWKAEAHLSEPWLSCSPGGEI